MYWRVELGGGGDPGYPGDQLLLHGAFFRLGAAGLYWQHVAVELESRMNCKFLSTT